MFVGNVFIYKCNGISVWVVMYFLFFILVKKGFIDVIVISDNWGVLMVIINVFGFSLVFFFYVKVYYFFSYWEDWCFSGFVFYDFFMGVEYNFRIGFFDFKFFFNGRFGIVVWILINLLFVVK